MFKLGQVHFLGSVLVVVLNKVIRTASCSFVSAIANTCAMSRLLEVLSVNLMF